MWHSLKPISKQLMYVIYGRTIYSTLEGRQCNGWITLRWVLDKEGDTLDAASSGSFNREMTGYCPWMALWELFRILEHKRSRQVQQECKRSGQLFRLTKLLTFRLIHWLHLLNRFVLKIKIKTIFRGHDDVNRGVGRKSKLCVILSISSEACRIATFYLPWPWRTRLFAGFWILRVRYNPRDVLVVFMVNRDALLQFALRELRFLFVTFHSVIVPN